ncbi:hypothetical protein AVEN_59173-1 [Araneus ventricosus]|uniref:Uncharacterized protein n=1 Tax=Araneus ventricosus TaxID=182803 RepID=A0A4Y2MBY8_ARAVE|nr:hypothetical protein AVEN_59173-1 [Araneus ventricosus]
MGRSLTLPLCLLALAGNNGVAFMPWVALPGEIAPDVHHPLLPGTPPCHDEATNRSTWIVFKSLTTKSSQNLSTVVYGGIVVALSGFDRPVPPFLLTTGGGRYECQAFHLSPKGPFNDHSSNCLLPLSEQQPAEIIPTSMEVALPITGGLGVRVLSVNEYNFK